jgi:NTE family protein
MRRFSILEKTCSLVLSCNTFLKFTGNICGRDIDYRGDLNRMEISLALGGGGSKGIAHLGVLRALEREGFQIGAVAGTSVGAVVGAIYVASNSLDEMYELFQNVDQARLYGRQPGDGPALLGVSGLNQVLHELLNDRTFADLRIPFATSAVDMLAEEEIVLKNGRVIDAVIASMALPGIFPPFQWGDRLLVDGGLLDPVPVNLARSLAPTLPIVAVVLSDPHPKPAEILEPPSFLDYVPVLRQIARLRAAQAFNIFLHSINISNRYLTEMRLRLDKPDVIIRPNVNGIGLLDQVEIEEVARRGEQAVMDNLATLRRAFSWRSRLGRKFGARINRYRSRI